MNYKNFVLLGILFLSISISFGACVTPSNNTDYYINSSTNLCEASYNTTRLIFNASNIQLNCNNSNLFSTGSYNAISVTNFDNVTIQNCNLNNYSVGILFNTVSDSVATNNLINNTAGDGININTVNNLTITYNNITNSADEGMQNYYMNDSLIKNNRIINTTDEACYTYRGHRNVWEYNHIENAEEGLGISSLTANGSSDNIIRHNILKYGQLEGIYTYDGTTNTTFENNTIRGFGAGIRLYGIISQPVSFSTIRNNILYNNTYGIDIIQAINNTIINNTLYNNTNSIRLYSSSHNNTVEDNWINNSNFGIRIGNSGYNNIFNNTITYSLINGIWVLAESENSTISNNDVNFGLANGIFISTNDNIIVSNNNASYNLYGIRLVDSNNTIVSNNEATGNNIKDFHSLRSQNTTVTNLTTNDTTSSFTYFGDLSLKSATSPEVDESGYSNIGHYLNVEGSDWAYINISYKDSDIPTGIPESTLQLWKHNGSWQHPNTTFASPNSVDVNNNYVYANITSFSILAPIGELIIEEDRTDYSISILIVLLILSVVIGGFTLWFIRIFLCENDEEWIWKAIVSIVGLIVISLLIYIRFG